MESAFEFIRLMWARWYILILLGIGALSGAVYARGE